MTAKVVAPLRGGLPQSVQHSLQPHLPRRLRLLMVGPTTWNGAHLTPLLGYLFALYHSVNTVATALTVTYDGQDW
jgi:hypothetical protein